MCWIVNQRCAPGNRELDEWGRLVLAGAVTPELLADARGAADACPMLALRLPPAPVRLQMAADAPEEVAERDERETAEADRAERA